MKSPPVPIQSIMNVDPSCHQFNIPRLLEPAVGFFFAVVMRLNMYRNQKDVLTLSNQMLPYLGLSYKLGCFNQTILHNYYRRLSLYHAQTYIMSVSGDQLLSRPEESGQQEEDLKSQVALNRSSTWDAAKQGGGFAEIGNLRMLYIVSENGLGAEQENPEHLHLIRFFTTWCKTRKNQRSDFFGSALKCHFDVTDRVIFILMRNRIIIANSLIRPPVIC